MSVFVKGMEMPQKCGQCKLFYAEHPMHCTAVEGHRTVGAPYGMPRPDWCPLVEVETHGRLIDADEFEREFNNHLLPILVKKYGEEEALKGLHFSFRDCICNIQCQKTVIEGSEE